MLNYEEELKKFKHCLSVDEVEETIYEKDLTDVIDLFRDIRNREKAHDAGAGE